MPAALVNSLAKETGIEFVEAEKRWKNAKAITEEQTGMTEADDEKFWQYVVGVFKKSMGIGKIEEAAFKGVMDEFAERIHAAAHEAATSPHNDLPEPTQAQKDAGTYKLGHLPRIHGLDIAIENPIGSKRKGVSPDGKAWETTMTDAHYGYIKRTEDVTGEAVDVFVGGNPESEIVFVIDQVDPVTGRYDEPKTLIGFNNLKAAKAAYLANYETGWKGLGAITPMTIDQFKEWLANDTTKPVSGAILESAWLKIPKWLDQTVSSTPGYLYHATNEDSAAAISRHGLKAYMPQERNADRQTWGDGSTDARAYFSRRADGIWRFVDGLPGRPVLLRVKDSAEYKREGAMNAYITRRVLSKEIEILADNNRWYNLYDFFNSIIAESALGSKKIKTDNGETTIKSLLSRIAKAPTNAKKDDLFTTVYGDERELLLEEAILTLPAGIYTFSIKGRAAPSLLDAVSDRYGISAMVNVDEKLLRGMAVKYPKAIQVNFTLGLQEIIIGSRKIIAESAADNVKALILAAATVDELKTAMEKAFATDKKSLTVAAPEGSFLAKGKGKPNTVYRDIYHLYEGYHMETITRPYDGSLESLMEAYRALQFDLNEFHDASNSESPIAATDAGGNPKYYVSPNGRFITDLTTGEEINTDEYQEKVWGR